MPEIKIKSIEPTSVTRAGENGIEQLIKIAVTSSTDIAEIDLMGKYGYGVSGRQKYGLTAGENRLDFFAPVNEIPWYLAFCVFFEKNPISVMECRVDPPEDMEGDKP